MITKRTLKKATAILLAFIMVFGAAPAAGFVWLSDFFDGFGLSAQAAGESNLTFKPINGGTEYEVDACVSSATGELTIPATYNGNPVTSIGYGAFSDCTSLSSITIPDGVTSIGDLAFSNCTGLSSITIPDGVTSIGDWAFSYCTGLSSVTIPDSVTSIGEGAFYGTSHNSITIPDSVTSIGSNAFHDTAWYNNQPDGIVYLGKVAYKYKGIMPDGTAIVIKDGTKSITDYAFDYCTGLISVTIPDSVTSIGSSTFIGCTSLSDITVSSANANYSSQDGVLFNIDKTSLIQYPTGNTRTSYAIPDSVTSIGEGAFYDCTGLSSVTIPDSVTSIGKSVFSKCTGLTDITVSSANANYLSQDGVLFNKEKTCLIQYPAGNTRTSYSIPDSVTSIEYLAISYCAGLSSVTIPDSVTSIGSYAFYYCTNLSSITIPDSVTSIGSVAFGTTALYNNQPDGIVYVGKVACDYKGTMPDDASIIIRDGTKIIADHTFAYCKELASITIPDSVEYIGMDAFYHCTGLSTITIPDNVKSIGNSAFDYCASLSDVYYGGDMSDRAEIEIGYENYSLISATWHYSIVVTGVSLDITSKTLVVSEAQQLTATVAPDDATNKKVIWSSSDTAIATVDENGLVSAIAAGTATITATTKSKSKTATCEITVICPTVLIKNLNNSAVIKYGETLRLTAVTTDMPKGAKVVWSVEGTGVKIVASDDGTTCDITSTESGRVTVTAKIVDADGKPIKGGDDNEISSSQQVESKAGFFQKLIAFFKRLFGLAKIIIQSVDR